MTGSVLFKKKLVFYGLCYLLTKFKCRVNRTVTMTNPSELVQTLRNTFNSGKTKPVEFRLKQLKALQRLYEENTEAMIEVLGKDLRKSKQESILLEIDYLINDLRHTIANLRSWVEPEQPPKGFVNMLDSLYIYNDPYGVVLVIGSWNYPIQLTLLPVAGAIAAGNCVVIKPSEVSSASSKFMAETIPKYLDSDCYRVFEGGVAETTALLKERFDYIFYTGSSQVGKIIHTAASQHLTPVTLELGGKSPVYLDKSADIKVATKRLLWGKCINAGQTCVAPDYLICTRDVRDRFVDCAKETIREFFGSDPKQSPDLCRIINDRQFQRLVALIKQHKPAVGGNFDASDRYVEPTILTDVDLKDPVMKDEIFGPILPVVTVDDASEAIKLINAREKPLVFYIFSNNKKDVKLLIDNTSSGGVLVNDTIMHMATDMPFGGVGTSGMGSYHGKYTFDTFSHKKSCLYKDLGILGETLASSRYPPYSDRKLKFLQLLLKKRQGVSFKCLSYLVVFGIGFASAVGCKHLLETKNFLK
jgi:acyl-CoA reductase-like NAD-dependent aldehyde dehydrogenase